MFEFRDAYLHIYLEGSTLKYCNHNKRVIVIFHEKKNT